MNRLRGMVFHAGAVFALALLAAMAMAGEAPPDKEARKPAAPARPAASRNETAPAQAAPPLRFSDDDLDKYRRPAANASESDSTDDEVLDDQEAATAQPPANGTPAPPGSPAPRPVPRRAPVRAAAPPAEDPLKPWKDRDALSGMRQEQIRGLREKITAFQSRLDYLNAKKGAISNPNPVQVGGTGERAFQYDQDGAVVVYTEGPKKGQPVTTPDVSPGRGQPKLLPIFPALPEPQTDQDREDDKRMKSKQLLEKVEEELKAVEEEISQAQRDLVGIETRFAQESGSR